MKLPLFLVFLIPSVALAYEFMVIDGKVYVAKEVTKTISPGGTPITVIEKVPDTATGEDQKILDEINSEKNWNLSDAKAEFDKRKTREYNVEEAAKLTAKIKEITDYGRSNSIDVASTTKTYESRLNAYKTRSR